jgi:hypothetical protein
MTIVITSVNRHSATGSVFMLLPELSEGGINFELAAWCRRVHDRGYTIDVQPDLRPFCGAGQNNEGGEVLLIADSLSAVSTVFSNAPCSPYPIPWRGW